jgi:DNA-binding MarR family transcriptional regulator
MEIQEALIRVQSAYPRIYLSCHTRHQKARTTPDKLSQRDGSILAHIDRPKSQRLLAHHMGMAKSTLSEALAGLEDMGYVIRIPKGRESLVHRTLQGTKVMSRGSVLESGRLRRLLVNLTKQQREAAVAGLELLALAGERSGRNVA